MAREQQSISETMMPDPLSPDLLRKMHAYWRAANYLSVGQIYLQDNPLLETPLRIEHIKPRLLGHWGTTTGLNFLYVHLNRLIKDNDLNMIYVIGPGHGGPGIVAHSYLEGSYTERYPAIERSRNGLQRLFRQFSWPYGIPSHVSPETPGSIHEGGELGYSLAHAYGAAFDNPDLIVSCIIGDGEAETGALAKGRVMEMLSEHMCEGWLEGYLLTGRHGLFSCYEAFIHIIDSMFNQHAKWLKVSKGIPWRKPIASLNYLLTSHVWRQDHNGFSHQDPGFIDHVANKKSDVVRIYLPPDANCLLSVADHCLRSCNYINLIIAGKQPEWQWLDIDSAVRHCTAGAGIWRWASNDAGDPDVVMACAGDVPTLETMAAVSLLRAYVPDIRIRVVNVVDLMVLQPQSEHPHGLEDQEFDELFTTDRPVIFAFHGYPAMIHKLTYRRHNHDNIHVRGFRDEGTTTTPFDMVVLNNLEDWTVNLLLARMARFDVRQAAQIMRRS
jgi:phosphoketolase